MAIANRIFNDTTDMRPEVKKRLQELQNLASGIYDSRSEAETEEIKESANFKGQGYLSGKTPFARMWTAVRVTKKTDEVEELIVNEKPDLSSFDFDNFAYDFPNAPRAKPFDYEGRTITKTKLEKYPSSGFKVYALGLNSTEQDIFGSKDGTGEISDIGSKLLPSQRTSFTNFDTAGKTKNLRPPAGITSVTSTTQNSFGPVAGILKTTINFTVYDFAEFDQIFSKYFMRPGAKVFVDFGFTDNKNFRLYDPNEFIKSVGDVGDYNEMIYGSNGQVAQSNYGIQCVQGQVTKFSSDLDPATGAYKCTIDVTSKNMQLFDITFEEDTLSDIKKNLLSNIEYRIIDSAKKVTGADYIWPADNENIDEKWGKKAYRELADLFAAQFLSSGQNNYPESNSVITGVYWKGVFKESGEDGKKAPITGDDALYISIGYLEDAIMNAEFGKYSSALNQFTDFNAIQFDSSNSYTTFDEKLNERQQFCTNNKNLPLLYPSVWNTSYNTIKNKIPEKDNTAYDRTTNDIKLGRIPIREMFIKLSLVKTAISQADSSKEVFQYIFNKVKDSTGGGWSWGMDSSTADNSTLAILDRNFSSKKFFSETEKQEKEQEAEQFYENMFMFEPYSPKTIVKNMSLNFSQGDGSAISSKLALQSLGSSGRALFATSELVDQTQRQMVLEDLDEDPDSDTYGKYKPTYNMEFFPPSEAFSDLEKIFCSFEAPQDAVGDPTSINANNVYGSDFTNYDFGPSGGAGNFDYGAAVNSIEEEINDAGDKAPAVKPTRAFKDYKAHLENCNFEFSSNPYEYFTKEYFINSIPSRPVILPIKLSLTLHGFTGLEPSDRFKINNIPTRYMNYVFFQVMRITHSITPGKFDTQVECAMRLRDTQNKKLPINNNKTNVMTPHALKNLHKLPEIEKILPFLAYIKPSVVNKNAINDPTAPGQKDHSLSSYRSEPQESIGTCEYVYIMKTLPDGSGTTNWLENQIEVGISADVLAKANERNEDGSHVDDYQSVVSFHSYFKQALIGNDVIQYERGGVEKGEEESRYRIRYTFEADTEYIIFMNGQKFVIWKDIPTQESWMTQKDKILYYFNLATGQIGVPTEDD